MNASNVTCSAGVGNDRVNDEGISSRLSTQVSRPVDVGGGTGGEENLAMTNTQDSETFSPRSNFSFKNCLACSKESQSTPLRQASTRLLSNGLCGFFAY